MNVSTNSSFTKKENETFEAQVSSGTKSMTMDESTLIKFRNNLFEVILYDLLHQVYCCFILYCVPKKALKYHTLDIQEQIDVSATAKVN